MSFKSQMRRNIKRSLKAGGFYDTRGVITSRVKVEDNSSDIDNYNYKVEEVTLTKQEKRRALLTFIGLIIGFIIMINIGNITDFIINIKETNKFKNHFNDTLELYDISDYDIEYTKVDSDIENLCLYKVEITTNSFEDKLLDDEKFSLLQDLTEFNTDIYCHVDKLLIYSNDNDYRINYNDLYMNDELIYEK